MANMSYCRFHNTKLDLSDCLDALSNAESLSHDEARRGKAMFTEFLEFCQDSGIIDGYDADAVGSLFDELDEEGE